MTTKPAKRVRLTSPAGEVIWAFVDKPSTKFATADKPDGTFSIEILLTKEQADAMQAQLMPLAIKARDEALIKADTGKLKKAIEACDIITGVTEQIDSDGNPTGMYVLKAKRDASYTLKDGTKVHVTIPIFDAAAPKPNMLNGIRIGKGSIVKVAFEVNPFGAMPASKVAGVSLRLSAVQVIKHVPPGIRDASAFGFGAEEGGFTAADAAESSAPFDPNSEPDVGGGVADDADF